MEYEYKTNREIAKEWILCGCLLACMLLLGAFALREGARAVVSGLDYVETRRATAECEKWADEAKVYPQYFLVKWQKMQCDTYGIAVDAPVKDYSNN